MKKSSTYFLVLMLLLACGREAPVETPSDMPLSFGAVSANGEDIQSRSTMATDDNLKTGSFGLYGCYSSVAGDKDNKFPVFSAGKAVEVRPPAADGENWSYSPLQYWKRNFNYRFRAYWPYDAAVLESASDADNIVLEYKIDEYDYDLSVAYATRNPANEGYGPVALLFRHCLSALRFNIAFDDKSLPEAEMDRKDRIESFYMMGLASSGHLSYNSETGIATEDWTSIFENEYRHYSWAGSVEFGVKGATDGAGMVNFLGDDETGNIVFAIPQQIMQNRTSVHFKTEGAGGEVEHIVRLPEIEWEPGKIYNYNFLVKEAEIEVVVNVKPWDIKSSTVIVEIV